MDSPRITNLYREIAKDFNPKKADKRICDYMQGLEDRLYKVEAALAEVAAPVESKSARKPAKAPAEKDSE